MLPGSNLPRAKIANQAAIRQIIYEYGPITRNEIAEKLSLTLPTITTNISNMIAVGILKDVPLKNTASQSVGRRASAVNFVDDSRYFIGLELRKHARHFCVTDYRGNVVYSEADDKPYSRYDDCVTSACEMLNGFFSSHIIPGEKIAGFGICLAGITDNAAGTLVAHPQNSWYDKNVREDIRKYTGYEGPITIENNSLARAYGAQLFKRELLRDIPSFTYLYIFTGIACPLILNNSVTFSNPVGPGEIGYMVIDPHQPQNEMGNLGTLQNLAGESAIIKRCSEAVTQGNADVLKQICGEKEPTFPQILEAQKVGDAFVDAILRKAAFFLGIAAVNMDNMVRPHSMLIEGRIFTNHENRKHFLNAIHENQFRPAGTETNYIFVDFDIYSGAKGASAVAIRTDLETYIP